MRLNEAIKEIKRDLSEHRTYCFVGAGLSARSDIPTWKHLLNIMADQITKYDHDRCEKFKEFVDSRRFVEAGQLWKDSSVFPSEKQKLFDQLFLHKKVPKSIQLKLVRSGFRGILTTNYDHLIEDAYARARGRNLVPFGPHQLSRSDFAFGDSFFLAKLHGDASDWCGVVIGQEDYSDVTWPETIRNHLGNKTLLVLGFGGTCPVINNFLKSIPNTHVYLIMPPQETQDYEAFLGKSCITPPNNVRLVPLEYEGLGQFLDDIRPVVFHSKVVDSTWGKMPPRPVKLDFDDEMTKVRDFLFSDHKLACIVAAPGSGLSSFLADMAEELSEHDDFLIYRLEAKEWLSLDGYILHVLGNLPDEAETYDKIRREETAGWTDDSEAQALASSFSKLGKQVVILFEHANRLSGRSLKFWYSVVSKSPSDFKLLLTTPKPLDLPPDTYIVEFCGPYKDSRVMLCKHHIGDETCARKLADLMPDTDLNGLVMTSCLVRQKVLSLEEIQQQTYSLETVCRKALKALSKSPSGSTSVKLLKTCALFRTPRTVNSLSKCTKTTNTSQVENCLRQICKYGFLIPGTSREGAEYAMSSLVRSKLIDVLPWEDGEMETISTPIAQFFEEESLGKLEPMLYTRMDIIRAVPLVSCALYHHAKSGNRKEYVDVVFRARSRLEYMYHFEILESWLDSEVVPREIGESDPRTNYKIAYTKARIGRVRATPKEYEQHLKEAQKSIIAMKRKKQPCRKEEEDILFEKGILLTMKRKYSEALKVFLNCFETFPKKKPDNRLKSLERIIQTCLSLGKLKDAKTYLKTLHRNLNRLGCAKHRLPRIGHHWAMYHRHSSTLLILQLLLYDRRPRNFRITKDKLLHQALAESSSTHERSMDAGYSHSRFMLHDMSGVGIAALKKAQALYAAKLYRQACEPAKKAIGILAGYPNSRWWRMCCHDVLARSLAMLGDLDKAQEHLIKAEKIFNISSQDDRIRMCELLRTKGLIKLQKENEKSEAISLLQQSLQFRGKYKLKSPCVEWVHRIDLAKAQLEMADLSAARKTLALATTIKIDW